LLQALGRLTPWQRLSRSFKLPSRDKRLRLTVRGDASIKAPERAMGETTASSRKPLGDAIANRLTELAAVSDEPGQLTRLYLGHAHRKAVDLVSGWMREAGMTVRLDAAANVVGRYEAKDGDGRALLIGSHIDTVRNAGRYDGSLGVVTGIEVVKAAHQSRKRYPFAIEVVAFGDEEGVRFPSTLSGSRALAGTFDLKNLDDIDEAGVSRREALTAFGCDPSRLPAEARQPHRIVGYVEVHIEQGPVLEKEGLAVGIVTAIDGVTRAIVEIEGVAGHAGTVPMSMRHDALAAAAEMLVALEARASSRPNLVATVGKIDVPGGAVNTIPGRVRFTLDVRSSIDHERVAAFSDIKDIVATIGQRRGVKARIVVGHEVPAAYCDAALSDQVAAAVETCGIAKRLISSGAGHDAMAFDRIIPFGMLFVRCRGGVSHSPDEFASPADIDVAARVLSTLLEIMGAQA
jgi:allantoate deiminase